MKKFLTYITIGLGLIIWLGTNTTAETLSNQLMVDLKGEDKDIREEDPFGFRLPEAPFRCMIDFTTLSVITERIPMVLSYELLDEAGETTIVSYSNDYDMVAYMSSLAGVYQLRLVTAESSYIGYLEL